jgi:uncharacterized protein YqjF (DUF2071 family)
MLAVQTARTLLNLPYYLAEMQAARNANGVAYDCRRDASPAARLSATYRSVGAPFQAVSGSLEHFLTERYCLYNLDHSGLPYRLEIHHPPWPLQPAEAEFACNTMADAAGVSLPSTPPILHFAQRQDMVAWLPTTLRSA